MTLEAKLEVIREKLEDDSNFPNESSISQGIVLPILQELNWDIFDTKVIRPENITSGKDRADFALYYDSDNPKVFIEVKRLGGVDKKAEKQVMGYAQDKKVHIAVLTDGRTWRFYLPLEKGSHEEKLVFKLDLSDHSSKESSEVLQRYLEKNRVGLDKALEAANVFFLLKKLREDKPNEWKWMVDGAVAEFKRTFDNFNHEIKPQSAQYNIAPDIVDYFHSLLREEISQSSSGQRAPRPQSESERQASASLSPRNRGSKGKKRKSGRSGKLVILERTYPYSNQSEAVAIVFKQLQERNSRFLQLFYEHRENKSYGGRRRYLGRNLQELFGDNVKSHRSHQPIGRDWIISTNYSWPGKKEIVKLAAEVAGLEFGKDIIVNFAD